MGKSLAEMASEIKHVNTKLGWYDKPVSFPEAMAMLHSEVSEALEAWRDKGVESWEKVTLNAVDAPGVGSYANREGESGFTYQGEKITLEELHKVPGIAIKPEGVGSEFADVLIRLLDDCSRWGVDLEAEYERKIRYNRTRAYRHGGKAI